MKKTTVLDRLIHKPVTLEIPDSVDISTAKPGDFVVYKDEEWHDLVWEYLWYTLEKTKKWKFSSFLSGKWLDDFQTYQEKAKNLYVEFKKDFWTEFPDSVPITAKASLRWDQYNRHERFDPSWLPLMYSIFRHPLEMVESDTVHLQQLDWRDPERLKDRSGKYNHTLAFEKEFYENESKRYPKRWWIVQYKWEKVKCVGNNYLTQEIKLRGKSETSDSFRWEWMVITLDEYLQDKKKKQW